jgi:PAS domain S-box-containing protein
MSFSTPAKDIRIIGFPCEHAGHRSIFLSNNPRPQGTCLVKMPFRDKGAVMLDMDGRIVFASTYVSDLLGVDFAKITGMSCFDFVFPEDMDAAKRALQVKLPNAAPIRARLRRADGTPIWADIQGVAMQPPNGEVYAISATIVAVESKTHRRHRTIS